MGWWPLGVTVCFPQLGRTVFYDGANAPKAQAQAEQLHGDDRGCPQFPRRAGWLLKDVTLLTALERTPGWFKVDYYGTKGWINDVYVVANGDCAQDV